MVKNKKRAKTRRSSSKPRKRHPSSKRIRHVGYVTLKTKHGFHKHIVTRDSRGRFVKWEARAVKPTPVAHVREEEHREPLTGKHVSITGKVNGIMKRVEVFSDNGRMLYEAVHEIIGTKTPAQIQKVPKEDWLRIRAEDMNPKEMNEDFKNGKWRNVEVDSKR